MFAFVLYDRNQDRYIASRDPIGIIPLYQGRCNDDGSVWFASEMKSIFEDCSKNVNAFEPGTLYDSRTGTCTCIACPRLVGGGFGFPYSLTRSPCHSLTHSPIQGQSDRWYKPQWWDESWTPKSAGILPEKVDAAVMKSFEGKVVIDDATLKKLKDSLEKAVEKQLMSEVPYGVLLSGGLDSSLIAAIAARQTAKAARAAIVEEEAKPANGVDTLVSPTTPTTNGSALWSPRLHSFSVGLPGSPDLIAARRVAKHIGTIHHEFTFTVEEGLDAVRDVIYHLETYDVTTIRASTPMYLLSRKIKATGVKMVLSGEGSDEVFGGYLYFHQAPNPHDLHVETVQRVKLLHTSDCLRANKSTMAWGLEARVPFLDTKLLDMAMTMSPEYKHPRLTTRKMEKETLRRAFDVTDDDGFGHMKPYLPADILWRQKEQFSDGVGYSWIDGLKSHAESMVEEDQWSDRHSLYPYNTPSTREAFFYRTVFEDYYVPQSLCPTNEDKLPILKTVVKWIPRADWGCAEDPSGRAQKVHSEAYEKGAAPPSSPKKSTANSLKHPLSPEKSSSSSSPTAAAKKAKSVVTQMGS